MIPDDLLVEQFNETYNAHPEYLATAPGRVNLIGEHTDYNGGFVLPVAIDRGIGIAARVRGDDALNLFSPVFNEFVSFSLSSRIHPPKVRGWYSYFLAVVDRFHESGTVVPGMDVFITGDVPLGAGLSSSAAFEVCTATLIDSVCKTRLSKRDIALLSQKAEHSEFVGVRCGIMDQFISALGKRDSALLIDCHTLEYSHVPFDSQKAAILIVNSMKKRGLVDSEYNRRREECEKGFQTLCDLSGNEYPSIRHIPWDVFETFKEKLSKESCKRIRHNLSENRRVHDFVKALKQNDFEVAGDLLYESHASLKDDYEVSCEELDFIVQTARGIEGVFGCRMTGAGFGGCTVALVETGEVERVQKIMKKKYTDPFKVEPEIYITTPQNGASISFT